jgi:carboxymethylenebutenolidase
VADADAPPEPDLVPFRSGSLTLHGFLYHPPLSNGARLPAVVYNHGSGRLPGDMRDEALFYVPHGDVLFVPHRRGHGQSADAAAYILAPTGDPDQIVRELAGEQTDDVMAAVEYVRGLPYVDPARVAVAGCSFGGIVSLFAAARGTGIATAVDFAGGAMSWAKSPALQERMTQAAEDAKVPVFFIQAENDFDTTPSRLLSDEMHRAGKPARVHVFPPNGTTHEDGHHFCAGSVSPAWGDEVLDFLRQNVK